jgi:hypothetical protein
MLTSIGYYNPQFVKHKEHVFNSNSLKNTEKHLRNAYKLNKDGDIWRLSSITLAPAQASGLVNKGHEYIIPFCQLKFKNAFLK